MIHHATKTTLFIGALALTLILGGCDSLSSYNNNPNAPTSANPNNVLAKAQRDLGFEVYGSNPTMRGTNILAQYTTRNQYVGQYGGGAVGYGWSGFYTALNDLKKVKELSSRLPNGKNIRAVATITQVWAFQILTDTYGDIPFKKALQGAKNRSPAYTPQKVIYKSLIDSLNKAIGNINVSGKGPSGDLYLGGDMENWKRFANGLKMRTGIRAIDAASGNWAKNAITSATGKALQSNDDNVYFQFATSSTHRNTYYENRFVDGRDDFDAARRFVEAMKQYGTNDPRMDAYFEGTSNTAPPCADGSGKYKGFPFEAEQQAATTLKTGTPSCNFSRPDAWWPAGPSGQGDAFAPIMYYDEILLTKAEAAARGIISGNPKDLLEKAIRNSVDFYGTQTEADISGSSAQTDAYVQAVRNDYDQHGYEQVIGEQRWIAFYFNNVQGWSTFRRLDFGGWLGPPVGGVANDFAGYIPQRLSYPSSEQNLNFENYKKAANRQFGGISGEDEAGRIWWEKATDPLPTPRQWPSP
ncbi:MAG: SusD/RagB family nutrient-binding outer membrane lipoprotein [Salinibacter sp.]